MMTTTMNDGRGCTVWLRGVIASWLADDTMYDEMDMIRHIHQAQHKIERILLALKHIWGPHLPIHAIRHTVEYKSNITTTISLFRTNKKKIGKNKYNGQCNKLMYGSWGMKNINACASNLESKNVVRLVYLFFFTFMFSSISNLLLFFFYFCWLHSLSSS